MLNSSSLTAIAAARTHPDLGKPLYNSYCFCQIPNAIPHLLIGSGSLGLPADTLTGLPTTYDNIVLLFLDGFGWRFFEQFAEESPLLKRALNQGVVSKLTTQFPSTTSVHTTTLHTGLPVGQSGIVEWYYYEPTLDRIIAPLLYSFYGDEGRETLAQDNIDPKTLFPQQTLYQKLKQVGVQSYCFQHQNYANSSFSKTVCDGATIMPYRTVSEAIANLNQLLTQPKSTQAAKGYYVLYIDSIDAISHRYGPESPQVAAEIRGVFALLETLLTPTLAQCPNTLTLITADHGQIRVSDEQTIFLSDTCPKLQDWMQTNERGELLTPSGGPRDFFLHVKDQFLEETENYLMTQLEDKIDVYRSQWLVEQGYFGEVDNVLMERLSPLILLPKKHRMICWQNLAQDGRYMSRGHHGGLTAEEMEIPLVAIASE